MRVDVVMCTYNSNKRHFSRVLESIRDYIPINRFIVVDKFSQDGTVEQVKFFFPDNSIIIQSRANLAGARSTGIGHVSTDWLAAIDDDVIILPGWFNAVKGFAQSNVGGVETGAVISWSKSVASDTAIEPTVPFYEKRSMESVTRGDVVRYGLTNLTRGYLGNTLIRTKAAAGWRPSSRLGAYEDYSLSQHIMRTGYRWVVIDLPLHMHLGWKYVGSYSDLWVSNFKKALWHGSNLRYVGIPMDYLFINSICRVRRPFVRLFTRRDPQIVSYVLETFGMFLALSTTKYEELRR